jgi:hypothetical protein
MQELIFIANRRDPASAMPTQHQLNNLKLKPTVLP